MRLVYRANLDLPFMTPVISSAISIAITGIPVKNVIMKVLAI